MNKELEKKINQIENLEILQRKKSDKSIKKSNGDIIIKNTNLDEDIKKIIKKKVKKEIKVEIKKSNKLVLVKDTDFIEYKNFTSPFLKWVGGKSQIIKQVIEKFPTQMESYHEIFLGGGSVLFGLLDLREKQIIKVNKVYAYDYNKPLIYLYKNIQTKLKKLVVELDKITKEFVGIENKNVNSKEERESNNINQALKSREAYYYWIRKQYNNMDLNNKIKIIGSAYFLFLNKTCFRGMHRIGPNGFNVPYGNYTNPAIYDEKYLEKISQLIKNVEFSDRSFEESIKNIKKGDYTYLDPPYIGEDSKSFVSYNLEGFSIQMHNKFFNMLKELKKQNINWMMSNSDTEYVKETFKDKNDYLTEIIECRRAINAKNPDSKTNEVIITTVHKVI